MREVPEVMKISMNRMIKEYKSGNLSQLSVRNATKKLGLNPRQMKISSNGKRLMSGGKRVLPKYVAPKIAKLPSTKLVKGIGIGLMGLSAIQQGIKKSTVPTLRNRY